VAERVLSPRELNRALLARQLLLERASVPLPRVLERVGGIQAQYAPSSYIALWTRMQRFERDDLTRALERRRVAQGTRMRVTIHLVSKRDYWPLAAGIRKGRRELWLKARRREFTAPQMEKLAKRIRSHMKGRTLARDELVKLAGGASAWNGVGLWLDLVRVPPSGTWERRRADLYARAEDWLDAAGAKVAEKSALEHVVRRYLGGFGPASLKDAADWAGLPPAALAPVAAGMKLRRFRDEQGTELLDLPRAPLPDAETPAPVRFLPVWDATLLAHARRTEILAERYRARVFNPRTPQSVATFLVDGHVAGTWKHERGRVVLKPFARLPATVRKQLRAEADRLTDFLS
jgi:Winged helix DNA-binding domain